MKEATINKSQINQWWDEDPNRNIGITVPGTIFDIDERHGGLATWAELCERMGAGFSSTTIQHTPTKGMHVFFAPSGPVIPLAGIDIIRPGKYVVASPSIHPLGGTYQWSAEADTQVKLPPVPPELLEPEWHPGTPTVAPTHAIQYAHEALRREIDNVRKSSPGARNNILNTAAFKLARFIPTGDLDHRDIACGLLDAALRAGLPETEARKTILSALNSVVK